PLSGHCTCKTISYTLTAPPLITHACHCTFCQRESGSAFALNALIESSHFTVTSATQPTVRSIPSLSSAAGDAHLVVCVKVGTLDDEGKKRVRPDVHIYTSTKMEWVELGGERARGARVFEEYYDKREVWSRESLERWDVLLKQG
ncbi:hypothetical protein CC86DRAFT_269563, partial [Ophiobolus disseminans]